MNSSDNSLYEENLERSKKYMDSILVDSFEALFRWQNRSLEERLFEYKERLKPNNGSEK